MREYNNLDKLLEQGIKSHNIFFAINIKNEDNELVTVRVLENVEGIEKEELLYTKEITKIKNKQATSHFMGNVYSATELKKLCESKQSEHHFWKDLNQLIKRYY